VTIREAWRIAGVQVIVTEHGLATEDDEQPLDYLQTAVGGVAACLLDGIDVRGYIAWTAFDTSSGSSATGPGSG
jgi:beta-glucosidase